MGRDFNPGPDIYAWEKPDIMALGLQWNFAAVDVMSPGARIGKSFL